MESLNLNTLVNSLPAQQNAEKELMNDFKAAALSITTLYRSSRKNAKRAYNSGYATACQDLLDFIQQGLSAGGVGPPVPGEPSNEVEGGGMTIGRVMDWTEARRDAIKVSEEDEEEDEEREKEKERGRSSKASTAAKPEPKKSSPNATASTSRISASTLPTPSSPQISCPLPPVPPSPSPPPPVNLRPTLQIRQSKARTPAKIDSVLPSLTQSSNIPSSGSNVFTEPFSSMSPNTVTFPETPVVINNGVGSKRRHHVMIIDSSGSTSTSSPAVGGSAPGGASSHGHIANSSSGRRRTRSSRNLGHAMQTHNQNLNMAQPVGEAMDVEEDGRERKRIARR